MGECFPEENKQRKNHINGGKERRKKGVEFGVGVGGGEVGRERERQKRDRRGREGGVADLARRRVARGPTGQRAERSLSTELRGSGEASMIVRRALA